MTKPEKAKGLKIYTITHDSFIYHTTNSHLGEVRSVKVPDEVRPLRASPTLPDDVTFTCFHLCQMLKPARLAQIMYICKKKKRSIQNTPVISVNAFC